MPAERLSLGSDGHIYASWHFEAMHRGESDQKSFEKTRPALYNEWKLRHGEAMNGSNGKSALDARLASDTMIDVNLSGLAVGSQGGTSDYSTHHKERSRTHDEKNLCLGMSARSGFEYLALLKYRPSWG
jgi:hypothetical protein